MALGFYVLLVLNIDIWSLSLAPGPGRGVNHQAK